MYYLIFYAVDMLLWSAALILTLLIIVLISGHRLSLAQKNMDTDTGPLSGRCV